MPTSMRQSPISAVAAPTRAYARRFTPLRPRPRRDEETPMTGTFSTSPAPRSRRRRIFLIGTGVVAGALAIGVYRFYRPRDRLSPPAALHPGTSDTILTAWIRLGTDGLVTVQMPRQEMGQGIASTLALIVAEEMDADPARVSFEEAPVDATYANATVLGDGVPFRPDDSSVIARVVRVSQFRMGEALGVQVTGGSTSVRDAWGPMRQAGATARAMLLQAAASRFGVGGDTLSVANGVVEHKPSGKRAGFGELAVDAGREPMPREVALKDSAQFVLLGKPQRRLDIPAKVDGSALFGIDTRLPGMYYAALTQSPVFGGSVVSFDGPNASFDSAAQRKRYEELLTQGDARVYDRAGDVAGGLAGAAKQVTADYYVPYLAHAAMEPINCTAVVRKAGGCEVWLGHQAPTLVKWFAARAADVDTSKVTVHTPYLGGAFGRRFEVDVLMQAVTIAKRLPDTPVQLIWSREEDMTHDVYRPAAASRFRAALD